MLVLEDLVDLHRFVQLQLLWHSLLGIDLNYYDIEWFALETNQDHSFIFEIAPKYCISDSFIVSVYIDNLWVDQLCCRGLILTILKKSK